MKDKLINCKHCKTKPVKRVGKIYCSRSCFQQSRKGILLKSRKILLCETCKSQYTTKPAEESISRFCSAKCRNLSPKESRRKRIEIKCLNCDSSVEMPVSQIQGRKFCSMECRKDFHNCITKCAFCNEEFKHHKNHKAKYCSPECYSKWLEIHRTGENHPSWSGGYQNKPEQKLRKTSKYKRWRTSVFERDDYTCQICKARGVALHAHHIVFVSVDPTKIFDIDNGQTVCLPCHADIHNLKCFGQRVG